MLKDKKSNLLLTMIAIFIATFMTSVETTIVTTAMPTIISKLNGLSMQSWIFAMYLLTTAVSTPIYGKLSDQLGRKPIFIVGLMIFSLGSFLCGIAPNIYLLVLFRAIQGIGAGAIMPITFTIIADLYSCDRRSSKLALNNTAWGISALLGPIIGGFIVDKLNWHWIFFINVPLGVLALLLIVLGLKDKRVKRTRKPIDYKGIFSLSVTLISLLVLFQMLSSQKLVLLTVVIVTLIFAFAFVLLVYFEKKSIDPIIPLKLFTNQLFTIQILTALLLSGMQIGFQIYFPIWLQSIYRVSASIAGLAVTPSPIMWLIASFFVGSLVKKFPPKLITIPIVIVQILFYLILIFAKVSFPMSMFYVIAGVTGAGLGIVITMNTLISQEVVPDNKVGTASSMLTLGRTLGQTIMTGVLGLTFNLSINQAISQNPELSLKKLNKFISSNQEVNNNSVPAMQKIIIEGMHNVFLIIVILFGIILIINLKDRNRKVVK